MTAPRIAAAGGAAAQARRAPLRRPPAGRPLRVKMISPAKTAADSRYWRPIKYSLFPPLGLATLAGYLDPDDEIDLQDEHVETLRLDDEPDLVVDPGLHHLGLARLPLRRPLSRQGAYVASAGCTSPRLPDEAARHADTVFLGPGEDTWPAFLARLPRRPSPPLYRSTERTLAGLPPVRRDLIKRDRYLVPNSLVVSRGCPHLCDFCYKDAFFRGGQVVLHAGGRRRAGRDRPPARPPPLLPRRPPVRRPARSREALFDGMRGHGPGVAGGRDGRLRAAPRPARAGGRERAAQPVRRVRDADPTNLREQHKRQNLRPRLHARPSGACTTSASWSTAASSSAWTTTTPSVFDRTVDWAIEPGHRDGDLPHPDAVPGHARSSGGSRPRAGSPAATGTSTTRATPCSAGAA